jgi:hypothetical protein
VFVYNYDTWNQKIPHLCAPANAAISNDPNISGNIEKWE